MNVAAFAALAWSIAYIVWRVGFTLAGTDLAAATLLLVAEGLAIGIFAARVRSARRAPLRVVVSPDAPTPDVAAVVAASGASVDELRTTLVAVRRVAGISRTFVVDTEGSRRLATIAERLGATMVDPSVGFDDAVLATGAGWVLLLRSGDLPMPDLVSVSAARCSSPDVAVIQVGIEEADPTSFDYDPDGHWSLEPFEHQVVRPSLAANGSIPWFGDGPSLVRRSALSQLVSIGGTQMLYEPRRLGLEITRLGMTVTHLPLTLARVPGPASLGESLLRRHERATRARLSPWSAELRGLRGSERSAHLLALMPWAVAIQRTLLVTAAVLVLAFGQIPLRADVLGLAVLAVPSYALRWNAHLILGRGRLGVFSILRSDLRSLSVDLLPFGRAPRDSRAGLGAVVVIAAALASGIALAALSMWRDWSGRLPIGLAATALVLATGFLGVSLEVLFDAMTRRQRRSSRRVRLGLVACHVEEVDGQLVDLSTGGAGVVVPGDPESLQAGDITTMGFRIPNADGAWRSVSAVVHVAHRRPDSDGGTRVGLRFDDPTDASLDPVVEFLTVDRRLVALGRHEATTH